MTLGAIVVAILLFALGLVAGLFLGGWADEATFEHELRAWMAEPERHPFDFEADLDDNPWESR